MGTGDFSFSLVPNSKKEEENMKVTDINIRDPYVLYTKGKYYLYGTRSETCWGPADGFDCYISEDFEDWDGPVEIFQRPEGFFADRFYWAPECYEYEGAYYLLTTLGSETIKKGIYVLKSDRPEGPFEIYSEELTPQEWTSIDGTLYLMEKTEDCICYGPVGVSVDMQLELRYQIPGRSKVHGGNCQSLYFPKMAVMG